jgi:hypothetical protein
VRVEAQLAAGFAETAPRARTRWGGISGLFWRHRRRLFAASSQVFQPYREVRR